MEVIKPLLLEKLQTSWVDPTKGDRERLMDNYLIGWGAAQAISELLDMETVMKSRATFLVKKEKGEVVDNFNIGA